MKNLVVTLFLFATIFTNAQSKQIKILGEKIKQKDLCPNLGIGNKCNPFPYGSAFILQNLRWKFPDTIEGKENNFKKIAKKYIGGKLIKQYFAVNRKENLPEVWIDIHSTSLELNRDFFKKVNFEINVPLDDIVKVMIQKGKLSSSDGQKVKSDLKNYFKSSSAKSRIINLTYHSANLNGNWYNKALEKDPKALELLPNKLKYRNILKDKYKIIGGLGVIEYNISRTDSISKNIKIEIDPSLNIAEEIKVELASKLAREVKKNSKLAVPSRFELIFTSSMPCSTCQK